MLRLFGVSQVDAVSVLGTLNKDKAEFLMTEELLCNTGEQWDGGEGAVNETRREKERDGFTERGI